MERQYRPYSPVKRRLTANVPLKRYESPDCGNLNGNGASTVPGSIRIFALASPPPRNGPGKNAEPGAGGSSPRHTAVVSGGARALLAAAEALDRLDAGETSKVELPPGSIVDPSRHQILAACRQIGVIPPAWPLPEGGWIGPIFLSAAKPGRAGGTHFTDLGKESAVVGCVVGDGLLNLVPAGKLIPPEAFVDEFFRLLYGAARAVLARGRMVCLESVQ